MSFMKIYLNNTSNNLGEQNNVDYCSEVDGQTLHSERHSAEKTYKKFIKGLSIYDGLLMMSGLHRLRCFFVPPKFES